MPFWTSASAGASPRSEKDLIWNAMAFICYEQVQNRQGPFYQAIKPLLAEDEE